MTKYGCCDKVIISRGSRYIKIEEHYFRVNVSFCGTCGSLKATTHVKEARMAGDVIITEKDGQNLRAEYFQTEAGSGCRFFINEEFLVEELYDGKSIHWAESAAENWISGVKTLNG